MTYITGDTIRRLREKKKLTQKELAQKLMVSDKTISKWETNKGLPDLSILPELANVLSVSVPELLTGDVAENRNVSANMKRSIFYVCPICGNIITSVGEGSFSCCGVTLPRMEAEECDADHEICLEEIEQEYYVTLNHPMSKEHYISFLAYVTAESVEIVKLYPEQEVSVRFRKKGHGVFYAFCNRHGLFCVNR